MTTKLPFIPISQGDKHFYLCNLPAGVLTTISYAAVRGRDAEDGAIQRVLNSRRISNIRDFALQNGMFPNSIVLNWVDSSSITIDDNKRLLSFDAGERRAQLIDGQHRAAGLAAAIEENEDFSEFEVPVALYVGLSTQECANIFLSINTEQKPVQRSLVFDLYAIADDQIIDVPAARARDIASDLNAEGAPYQGMIKFPGEPARKGGVALSTAVSAIKPLIESNGTFDQVGLSTLENQTRAIENYFQALRQVYGDEWFGRNNAFMFASGFSGAIEFLEKRLVPYCQQRKSFSIQTFREAFSFEPSSLIYQNEISGKSGSQAVSYIFSRLDDLFTSPEAADEYDF